MKVKRPRSAYTQEYKAEAVRLYDSGIGLAAAARKLGIADQTLHACIQKRDRGQAMTATAANLSAEQLGPRIWTSIERAALGYWLGSGEPWLGFRILRRFCLGKTARRVLNQTSALCGRDGAAERESTLDSGRPARPTEPNRCPR